MAKTCIIIVYAREKVGRMTKNTNGNGAMSENFIDDLNAFFCKYYSNFDFICSMPSYESMTISMILKNKNRIEEGEYAANEMRKISFQNDPDKVLAEIKERYVDNTFTFSVRVAPMRQRFLAFFGSKNLPGRMLAKFITKYGEDPASMADKLGLDESTWKDTLKGIYIPEKVLLFKVFLLLGMRKEDCDALMKLCGAYYNFEDARDVVVRYLIGYRVFNREMIDAAFDEYHIRRII